MKNSHLAYLSNRSLYNLCIDIYLHILYTFLNYTCTKFGNKYSDF